MNLSLEQLRTLHAVAQTGSFSAAARKLGKVQSAISTTMANLEIDLGLTLFNRSGHTPRLTAAGERILQEARQVLAQCAHIETLAAELAGGCEPALTLAVDDAAQLPWLAPVLHAFSDQFPTVELELLFPHMGDLCSMLVSGRAHLGIGYHLGQYPADIHRQQLTRICFPVVVSVTHPLASLPAPTLVDLRQSRQILITNRQGEKDLDRFRHARDVWWVEGDQGVLDLVKRGFGWAAVPEFLLPDSLENGEIVILPIDLPGTGSGFELELLHSRNLALGKAGRWLRQVLLDNWQPASITDSAMRHMGHAR